MPEFQIGIVGNQRVEIFEERSKITKAFGGCDVGFRGSGEVGITGLIDRDCMPRQRAARVVIWCSKKNDQASRPGRQVEGYVERIRLAQSGGPIQYAMQK